MSARELLEWWNLIYLLPLALSVVWLLAAVLSGDHHASADGHHAPGTADHGHFGHHADTGAAAHGAGHGIGHGIGHGVGHGAGHGIGHGAGHGAGHGPTPSQGAAGQDHAGAHGHPSHSHGEQGSGPDRSWGTRALDVLGIGRTPVTILVGTLLLSWGSIGLLMNQLLGVSRLPGAVIIWPSLAVTALASLGVTRAIVGSVGRLMPATESYAITGHELVGRTGKTVYRVTGSEGTVQVADASGTIHRVMARTLPGSEPIAPGQSVLVVSREDADGRYLVQETEG